MRTKASETSDTPSAAGTCPFSGASSEVTPTGCPVSHNAANFDPFEGEYQLDPAEALRWSREQEPIFYSPKLSYWVVTRYDDVKAIFRDNILFSPSIALEKITPSPPEAQDILNKYGYAMNRTMVNEDEPAHMQRRRLLMDSFTPEALARMEPKIRKLTQQYMDRFIDKGEVDIVADMLWEIPLTVALQFLGVEDDQIDELRQFGVAHTINTWGRPSKEQQLHVADSVGRFWVTANRVLDKMMEDPSGEGWMYFSIRQHLKHPDVVPLSYLRSMMMAILVAAHETTSKATANALRLLLSDRETWSQICSDTSVIPMAVEECLRRAGSIVAWRRLVTEDTEVGGVKLPKGAKLLMVMASANHDERQFENPELLDLHRENAADHLSFGYGAHQCMGKNIARMEMRVFIEEFAKRLPHAELMPNQKLEYMPNTSFRGPESLWLRWDPSKNPERADKSALSERQSFKIGTPSRADIARPMKVVETVNVASDLRKIVLESPDGRPLPAWSAGAHIHILAGEYDRRYSLCGRQEDQTKYEIVVLREDAGRGGSRYIHEQLKVGDAVRIRGPKNHFRLQEDKSDYLLVAGGIGITPIVSMADRLKKAGKKYSLHYAGKSSGRMAFLDRIKREHPTRAHFYSSADGNRLNLKALVSNSSADTIYACGPGRMLSEMESVAKHFAENLHMEHFLAAAGLLDPEKESGFEIELRDSQVILQVPPDKTVLDVLEAAGIDVPCDCREGLCGSCEVQVVDGDIDHRDRVLSQTERAQNTKMMTCCSRAKGKKVVLGL
jgi:cytochrome P450/ferredoxin-NADP reductase